MINVIGLDNNIGTTTIALSLANQIQKMIYKKAIVLNMQPYSTGIVEDYHSKHLNDIKHILSQDKLDIKLSYYAGKINDELYYLAGNNDVMIEQHFSIEEGQKIIDLAKSEFPIVVADCGHLINNPLSVSSLENGAFNIVVTSQNLKQADSKHKVTKVFDLLKKEPQLAIVNMYQKNQIYEYEDIQDELNVAAAYKVNFNPKLLNQRPTIIESKEIMLIAKYVLQQLGHEVDHQSFIKTKLKQILGRVN